MIQHPIEWLPASTHERIRLLRSECFGCDCDKKPELFVEAHDYRMPRVGMRCEGCEFSMLADLQLDSAEAFGPDGSDHWRDQYIVGVMGHQKRRWNARFLPAHESRELKRELDKATAAQAPKFQKKGNRL